ncbi:hypothetical protein C1X69_25330 [Pseudomonas sp. FW305-67]|nr:hypothetical protein C1X70_06145 [Pseudomonas sp. FW305-53]PMY87082.1 hypothetical protein C1X68_10165 [Pseudomonas sp. FW303-C2]PMY90736.1 hypothetical protein C1X67_22220 [Pseudomonas sp. FW305-62]PNA39671.1 hypothetical protein C1X71_25485 [Pseudomonas sp. FW306-2-2C-A10BC]PNA83734.1 hypothetical protein C1X66_24070 [Pseudomonas sp. MPR-R3B]PNB14243.1 hypothetical protein C1X69_25330 [Pseudomonas sp. FW305-67]
MPELLLVARGLAPVGARSGPKSLRLLRSRTGRCGVPTSPLATGFCVALKIVDPPQSLVPSNNAFWLYKHS